MSIILAIETSFEVASIALLQGTLLTVRRASGVETHSHTVLPMVQLLLAGASLRVSDCTAIAFGAGPGSFTGVRTACGIAQGLAFGAGRPILAINTLESMAEACHQATGASSVLALLDARMGEVYWAQYAFEKILQCVVEPQLSRPAAVHPVGPVVACGNGLTAYPDEFSGAGFWPAARADLMPDAGAVAVLAQRALVAGLQVAARDAQPIYLRNKIALTSAERDEKKRQVVP